MRYAVENDRGGPLGAPGSRSHRQYGRGYTRDNFMTFDGPGAYVADERGNMAGRKLDRVYHMQGDSARTYDTTGAFLVGELERLDMEMHKPLVSISFGRDIDIREDVTIADEISSFTLTTFGASGGLGTGQGIGTGKAWVGKVTNQVAGVAVDIGKKTFPLTPWAQELKYDMFELESAAKVGRPIDAQKFEVVQMKHQMDIDEQVYYGDVNGATGLTNNSLVTNVSNVANGAQGTPAWTTKTPAEILADVNTALATAWAAAAWAVIPKRLLLPPNQFSYISTELVSLAGTVSILKYLEDNNILAARGEKLEIFPLKWLVGAGVGGTLGTPSVDRMLVYTKEKKYVRFPMTLLARTPVQYDGLYMKSTYYCKLGVVECVYPQTIGYSDGI
jgi:hypothetical protein